MPTLETESRVPSDADVQRRAYRALNEDGLVDFSLGLGLSFAALYVGLWRLAGVNMAVWSGLFPIFVMLIARGLRKRFVYPRIGYSGIRNASPAILMMATLTLLLVAGLVVMTIYARRGVRPPATLFPWLLRLFALAGAATLALIDGQEDKKPNEGAGADTHRFHRFRRFGFGSIGDISVICGYSPVRSRLSWLQHRFWGRAQRLTSSALPATVIARTRV